MRADIENQGTRLLWDERIGKFVPADQLLNLAPHKPARMTFVQYDYEHQLKLATISRCPLIAVQAELYRQWFTAWDKSKPVEFSSSRLRELGFDHHAKKRGLQHLQSAGIVSIEWRKGRSPLVTVLGFRQRHQSSSESRN